MSAKLTLSSPHDAPPQKAGERDETILPPTASVSVTTTRRGDNKRRCWTHEGGGAGVGPHICWPTRQGLWWTHSSSSLSARHSCEYSSTLGSSSRSTSSGARRTMRRRRQRDDDDDAHRWCATVHELKETNTSFIQTTNGFTLLLPKSWWEFFSIHTQPNYYGYGFWIPTDR